MTVTIVEFNKLMGEEPLPLSQYLNGVSRHKLLTIGAHFIALNPKSNKHLDYGDFLNNFFSTENEAFKQAMIQRLKQYRAQVGKSILIINTVSSLEFFQYVFDRDDEPEIQTVAEIERNVFLAYLALNQTTRAAESKIIPSLQGLKDDEALPALFFTQSYAYSNLVNYELSELITGQLIKAAFLFDFLKNNNKTQELYQKFLDHYGLKKGTDFLVRTMSFIQGILSNEKEGFVDFSVPPGEKFETDCDFIEKLILPEGTMDEEEDFIRLRERPFYRLQRGKYRVIFKIFVIEKIFKSLYFSLKTINDSFEQSKQVKGLRTTITDEFSEKVIVYEILNSIYNQRYITFTGKELKDQGIGAEPDYYFRKGKRIFLFESKDFLIDAAIKTSYDYTSIRPVLQRTFLKDHKDRAILQLLKSCERILSKQLNCDKGYDETKVIIYPIVVVHDNQYNVLGLNHIVNVWFEEQIAILRAGGVRTQAIRPLTIINIDTLIFHQDLIRSREVLLEDIIEAYIKRCSLKNLRYKSEAHKLEVLQKRMMPFANFFNEYPIVNSKATTPRMLKDKVGILFKSRNADGL